MLVELTQRKADPALQGIELKERKYDKKEYHMQKLIRRSSNINDAN